VIISNRSKQQARTDKTIKDQACLADKGKIRAFIIKTNEKINDVAEKEIDRFSRNGIKKKMKKNPKRAMFRSLCAFFMGVILSSVAIVLKNEHEIKLVC